ncbi:OsmC family protein [Roseospira marina]|uniref:OsmC family protein n=1 Tax=Roseospira marina TaxID=140057 RepID=A0A5M6IE39_9PROT|nr:OsmC family protein [Roseospira marina]KAA5606039.1 OsmC family protein [Roseospira marina]MBB4313100.1 osmotically inducible protein OsmC [Roseospira marina]MBB5086159.1 osmotically inducible protein OsmC [Roseospira marina]
MPTRSAKARWTGALKDGAGTLETGSGLISGSYSFPSRFENGTGTTPEELIAAAHAGCYAMAFSALLGEAGHNPEHIDAEARVTLTEVDGKPTITKVHLTVSGSVPGLDADGFREQAEVAKAFCPVSRALAGVEITLEVA